MSLRRKWVHKEDDSDPRRDHMSQISVVALEWQLHTSERTANGGNTSLCSPSGAEPWYLALLGNGYVTTDNRVWRKSDWLTLGDSSQWMRHGYSSGAMTCDIFRPISASGNFSRLAKVATHGAKLFFAARLGEHRGSSFHRFNLTS